MTTLNPVYHGNRTPDSSFVDSLTRAVMDRSGSKKGDEVRFRCPADGHEDKHPSARWNAKKATWVCDVCKQGGGAYNLADLLGIERPGSRKDGGINIPSNNTATLQHSGCTLAEYAAAKRLSAEFLKAQGVAEVLHGGKPAVRLPYLRSDGTEGAVRYRRQMAKTQPDFRFIWKKGSRTFLYGLDRIDGFRDGGWIVLLEGESDTQTAWYHGIPAVGLPGAANWREDRDAQHFEGFERIYIIVEPDTGGDAVKKWLETSSIRDRVLLIDPGEYKDLSGLHIQAENFDEVWSEWLSSAQAWSTLADKEAEAVAQEAWEACKDLARQPDITSLAADYLESRGVVGTRQQIRLLYEIVTSRFLDRPINASLKGPSSGGKSYVLEQVLKLFPNEAYYSLSGMSEKALIYDDEPLIHRYLVIYEAAGLTGDFASYLMRSLLSEGRVHYVTVEKTSEGIRPRTLMREGPTGLLTTTTAVHLHPENETRMLSIPILDGQDQTARILESLAADRPKAPEAAEWHALQVWIARANHDVVIPFATELAKLIPPIAVRLRRDFSLLLSLIRSNAILHQATREQDDKGRIIATMDDYAVAYELAGDLLAAGIEATVPETLRETVAAVAELTATPSATLLGRLKDDQAAKTTSVTEVAKRLRLDKSAASRRVRVATDGGYLRNLEEKRGRPARITLGDPLPEDQVLLPSPDRLRECCSVAGETESNTTPPNVAYFAPRSCFARTGTDDLDLEPGEVVF